MIINWLKGSILPPVAAGAIRVFGASMQLFTVGESTVDALYARGERIIIAFWHGRQVMMPLAYRGRNASILISHHRDGELIARIMKSFGFGAIRGSTTRGGVRALRQLIREGRRGGDLVMTPDGPKGPACQVQHGILYLAKITGCPIVPLTFSCSKKKSSPAGITFKFLFQGVAASLCGVILYGCHGKFPRGDFLSRPNC
ncbi:MAG TPA: lysophospholipid acyltransferase family protein [Nitrospirales bacterium]|nr:lysophospholipid acyltransferase family protein [Nitrospirales bacterium]